MKKLFVTGALLVTATSAFAQTEKGSLMIGSNISELQYASSKGESKEFGVVLTPNVGVFVVDRLALGAELTLAYTSTKLPSFGTTYKTSAFTYGVAPFARYYVADGPKHKFFGQAQYGILGYRIKYPDGGPAPVVKDSYGQLGLSVGYNYFISPNVALEVAPYYRHANTDLEADTRANQWGLAVGFQIFFPKTAAAAQ
ncbi:outer membrane beta-barrel protein [Hymenobacter chitinivorans]|uniref:Outer membrane protein with beta-barrel domain n=1 Tax=Hymenobacter chitinivorans DSM 11115 TaxID=1121954 RepID=A0A2M9B5E2_9BACT|nr:outer membrane beta-barrel protein [Hymenobacter chitinivorans]PJJ53159.1 outer membrane protein with beta-barrel domain [Hymenobacter chitinivorans DSM 11115]